VIARKTEEEGEEARWGRRRRIAAFCARFWLGLESGLGVVLSEA
jgi:hypothetical protein